MKNTIRRLKILNKNLTGNAQGTRYHFKNFRRVLSFVCFLTKSKIIEKLTTFIEIIFLTFILFKTHSFIHLLRERLILFWLFI